MAKNHLSSSVNNYIGSGYDQAVFAVNRRKGVPVVFLTKVDLGSPIAADLNAIIAAAAGSGELPNNSTKTFSAATTGTGSPCDDAGKRTITTITTSTGETATVWPLDVPRALSYNGTHGSSVVSTRVTVTGYDKYFVKMKERVTLSGTTSVTVEGTKAFAYIEAVELYSASDTTTNTGINVGWKDVLGLPYVAAAKSDVVRVYFNGVLDDSATVVAADATATQTISTGDVRGTVDTNSAADGSAVVVYMHVADPDSAVGIRGIAQYGG